MLFGTVETQRPMVFPSNYAQYDALALSCHRHDQNQLLVANRGVITLAAADRICVAPPGHAIWVPAGVDHATEMVKPETSLSFLVDKSLSSRPGPGCEVINVDDLLHELLQATAISSSDDNHHKRLLIGLLAAEISRAERSCLGIPRPQAGSLADLCECLLAEPHASVTIDQAAHQLDMNRRAFTRMFRRETGLSFCAWRERAYLAAALPRLRAGEAITVVATELGYQRPSTFSAAFKRIVGVAPSLISSSLC